MKKLLLISSIILIYIWTTTLLNAKDCGSERWLIKTCQDPQASMINRLAEPISIELMRTWKQTGNNNIRSKPYELQSYVVSAKLVGYKMEDDKDIHLVLSDKNKRTIIAEIPNPLCAENSVFLEDITNAYNTFTKAYKLSRNFRKLNIQVIVTGIGFFDKVHGQTGVPANGIELHPVLSIQFIKTKGSI